MLYHMHTQLTKEERATEGEEGKRDEGGGSCFNAPCANFVAANDSMPLLSSSILLRFATR
jgi:hypothetical protein